MGRVEALGMLNLSQVFFISSLQKSLASHLIRHLALQLGERSKILEVKTSFWEFLGVNIPQNSFNSCITETVNLKIFWCISTLARLCIEQLVFSMILWPKFWKLMLIKFYCKMMPKRHSGARWNKLNKGQVETSHYLNIIFSLELGDELKFFDGIQITPAYLSWHLYSYNVVSWKFSNQ